MFNLSGSELIFLVLIALVVLGPDKLPDAMRKAGKAYADFKKMTTGFQTEMKSVLDEPLRELRETAELAKQSAMFDVNGATSKPVSGSMAAQTPAKAAPSPAVPVVPEPSAAPADESAPDATVDDATARRLARATPPDLNVSTMDLRFGSAEPPRVESVATARDDDESADSGTDTPAVAASLATLDVRNAAVAGGDMRGSHPVTTPAETDAEDDSDEAGPTTLGGVPA